MSFFKSILTQMHKRAEYRHAVDQLSRMSDRELSDIGINRADIHDIVRQEMVRKSSR
jgi:uncharacterized protein YjiS (DUF1127 family)